ncbi:MAG: efflux RND transporter periplasmic adaptor subunit [Rickettsiales bacterium]|jgi:HlyD family secretion protein|nr:efflux RND transporter periplasmic adaptor subunit [Rickettsiales bacterium]
MKKILNWMNRHKWLTGIIILALGTALFVSTGTKKTTASQFVSTPITRGELKQVVTATGEIKPLNTIKVGSQVSGNIEKILVDYNSEVKKGDILLTIDPSVLQASLDEAKASLDSANAQLSYDRADYNRNKTLYNDGYIARAELEQSETRFKTSEQSVKRTQSQFERAKTNLGYATIISPVDGVVISRKVDKGQTVQASFSAPDLFEIAEDLKKMQIETSISEADIGMIKDGQTVSFTVDAYPTQSFQGTVNQIRLSPTTASSVVVYTVVIGVDNSDMRLMPGMTAFVTITIESKADAWRASNSAFLLRTFKGIMDDSQIGDKTPREYLLIERAGKTMFIKYSKGLSTATETEIVPDDGEELQKGDRIITGRVGAVAAKANTGGQSFGSRSNGGAPRM